MQQDCQHCSCLNDASIPGEKGNFLLHVYERQPWFSHLELMCKQCQKLSVFYFGPDKWQHYGSDLRDLGLAIVMEAFAPDDLIERWRIIYELPKLDERKLTKRLEAEVAHMGFLIEAMPPELLFKELTDPAPPCNRPQTWTDE